MPHLSSIHIYPIKSSAGIELSNSWVDELGLAFDRRFVLTNTDGQFITARTKAKLCLVQASLTPNGLILTAPKMPLLTLNYQDFANEYKPVTIWGDNVQGQYCGDNASAWFSAYLNSSCRLLFFGEQSTRERVSNSTGKKRQVSFADGYPLLLISQASLNDLNNKLQTENTQVSMARFRPNVVIENCHAFAEDSWQRIRIGEVEFELAKPCARCIFTTVNPENAQRHSQKQPLTMLKSYRQIANGEILFGQNLIPLNQGQLKQGDKLTVLTNKDTPTFI